MSNHMDLTEIRKTIEWMTAADGWKVQKDATGDPALRVEARVGVCGGGAEARG